MIQGYAASTNVQRRNVVTWAVMTLEGLVALIALLRIPSEGGSALFLGFSWLRLVIIGIAISAVGITAAFAWAALRQPAWWRSLSQTVNRFFSSELRAAGLFLVLAGILVLAGTILAMAAFLGPDKVGNLWPVYERTGLLMAWGMLGALHLRALISANIKSINFSQIFNNRLFLAAVVALVTGVYLAALRYYNSLNWDIPRYGLEKYLLVPLGIFLVWGISDVIYKDRAWFKRLDQLFLVLSLAAVTLVVYRQSAYLTGWINTPPKAYWPLLSESFLEGRLYLVDPPDTHDLTFYNGQWYVPNPPLPAFILLPLVALKGAESVNTVTVSIWMGVINVVLVYLVLARATGLGMIPTNRAGNLWLTAVFALSTSHWWLAFSGRMWYVSQLLTLTFAALAVLAVLYHQSPWLAGVCLGAAVLARPNVFTLWPFLAGTFLYIRQQEQGAIQWKRILGSAVQSAVPVCLAAAGLLYYNHIRFDDWLDFGYVTIHSSDWIMSAARTYGIFNLHFVPINLHAMFLKMPRLFTGWRWDYSPSHEGLSIFAMMPAAIYLFRPFLSNRNLKFNWWLAGAWASVLLSLGLLVFYHNTGAWQLGYRYVLDFILPLLLLLAVGVGRRPSLGFKLLAVLGMAGNLAGIAWWYQA